MTTRISAAEAASRLGVKRETIYAYVSRGLLQSRRALDGKSSTFDPAEIDRVRRSRNSSRPGRLEVAVASGITEVTDGHVAYRGHNLVDLVHDGWRFESVAELLWSGELSQAQPWTSTRPVATAVRRSLRALGDTPRMSDVVMAGVVAAAAADPFRDHRSATGVASSARIVMTALSEALPARHDPSEPAIAATLWSRLTDADPDAWPLLDRAMVVLADHGMATSTLAARLAASTRSGPLAAVSAALGPVSGPLHGAACRVVHELFLDAEANGADAAIGNVIQHDGAVPGIGHFIHKCCDPRHDLLFDALTHSTLDDKRLDVVATVLSRTNERIPAAPNIDLALGALTYVAGMAPDAGEAVFAIARIAGWMAHALEEYGEAPLRFRPVGRFRGARLAD